LGFSLGPDEQLNLGALQEWIGTLIKDYANDLFRYKGVIAVKGKSYFSRKEKSLLFNCSNLFFC